MDIDLILEHVLSFIDDFYSYFSAQTVSMRWCRILRRFEEMKLLDFSVRVSKGLVGYYILPNKKLHGMCKCIIFSHGSSKLSVVNYIKGLRHGAEEIFYTRDNVKYHSIAWINGVKHGLEEFWRTNGQIYSSVSWVNGCRHGLCQEWHSNGILSYSINLLYGVKHGTELRWYNNAELASRRLYDNGVEVF